MTGDDPARVPSSTTRCRPFPRRGSAPPRCPRAPSWSPRRRRRIPIAVRPLDSGVPWKRAACLRSCLRSWCRRSRRFASSLPPGTRGPVRPNKLSPCPRERSQQPDAPGRPSSSSRTDWGPSARLETPHCAPSGRSTPRCSSPRDLSGCRISCSYCANNKLQLCLGEVCGRLRCVCLVIYSDSHSFLFFSANVRLRVNRRRSRRREKSRETHHRLRRAFV